MSNLHALKSRIESVRDTKKITNAMYFIASSKMQTAKSELESTRPFFEALRNEIKRIFRTVGDVESPYFYPEDGRELPEGRSGCLVITADKGLAGDYNINVIKETLRLLEQEPDMRLFVAGEYGRHYFSEHDIPYEKEFTFSDQHPTVQQAREISSVLLNLYDNGDLRRIFIVYTDMKNTLTQNARLERLLPFHHDRFITPDYERVVAEPFEFFPSVSDVLNSAIPCYIVGYIYSALIDSYCSEQSARMIAMQSANENANRIIRELAVEYNRARQGNITQEITEISAGAKAQIKRRRGGDFR